MTTPTPIKGALFPTKHRRKCVRSKEGCLTCRNKRKKCDEMKPVCTDCSRTQQHCVWPRTQQFDGDVPPDGQGSKISNETKGNQLTEADNRLSVLKAYLKGLEANPGALGTMSGADLVLPAAATPDQLPSLPSFLVQPPLTSGHLSDLNDVSRRLYQHYCDFTAGTLVRGPSLDGNPFLTHILPLAASDWLIMNTLLALGGAHLSVNVPSAAELEVATRTHYASVVVGLRDLLADSAHSEARGPGMTRLLLALLLLCLYEGVHGGTHGAVYHHLQASRNYALQLASDLPERNSSDFDVLHGLVLELYAFLALKLAVTPRGHLHDQPVHLDAFLNSLGFLRSYTTRGFMIGFGQEIFETIPSIAHLVESRRRLEDTRDEKPQLDYSQQASNLHISYRNLLTRLHNIDASIDNFSDLRPRQERAAATTVYQNALILHLHSSFNDNMLSDEELMANVEVIVQQSVASFLFLFCGDSPFRRMLLWPAMIIASCARRRQQREGFSMALGVGERTPGAVKEGARLIEALWKDSDPRAFGPRGLSFVMRKHGISFSMC